MTDLDTESLGLLEDTLRKTMLSASGAKLDTALADLGWGEMLSDMPEVAMPLVFRLLGETGSHASILNDVLLETIGGLPGGTPPMPYAGGIWVVWEREDTPGNATMGGLPLKQVPDGQLLRISEARQALGWWLVGSARAMLALARQHALDRVQFGKPISSFQAVRHRLAETLVAIEGAEATLNLPNADNVDLNSLLAKAAAGKAALTAAKHCQQVLGGIGFTAEHELHHHVKRVLVLDGLLGSSRNSPARQAPACAPAGPSHAWPSCRFLPPFLNPSRRETPYFTMKLGVSRLLARGSEGFGENSGRRAAPQYRRAAHCPVSALVSVGMGQCASRAQHRRLAILGVVGQTRRFVDRVTDHGVFIAVLGADVAREHRSARNADAELHIRKLMQPRHQRPRGRQGRGRRIVEA